VTATNYYSYCNCSAVDQEATVIQDGTTKTYITGYTYNYVGGIMSITYPSGKTVNYTRDSLGRETKVSSPLDWRSIDYVRSASYLGPQGGLTQIETGIRNGSTVYLTTNITYSSSTMRMTTLQTHGVYLSYKYDVPGMTGKQTGHIYDIDDLYDSTGENNSHYEYDQWYRLTRWWQSPTRGGGGATAVTWTYGNYGNITRIFYYPDTWNFDVNPLTNRLQGTGYLYDAAGNMTGAPGGVTRTFDAENRMTSTNQGGLGFLYDGGGRRLRKMAGTTKIYFVYSSTGRLLVEDNWTASTTKDHIYFNGQLIATRDQANYVRVFFKDHLGSVRSVVKVFLPTGSNDWGLDWTTVEVHDYEPYGNIWSTYWDDPEQTSQRFTGQKRDNESGLHYFGARYYDAGPTGWPTQRNPRWISADSIIARIYDPPSLNKYAYVRNDPVNLVDPDGKQFMCRNVPGDPELGIPGHIECLGWLDPPQPTPLFPQRDRVDRYLNRKNEWWNEFLRAAFKTLLHGTAEENETFKDCLNRNLRLLGIDTEKVQDVTNQIILSVGVLVAGLDATKVTLPPEKSVSVLNAIIGVITRDILKFVLGQPVAGSSAAFQTIARLLKGGAIGLEITAAAAVGTAAGLTINCREAYGK